MLANLALSLIVLTQAAPAPGPHPRIRLEDHLPAIEGGGRSFEAAIRFVERGGEDDLAWTPPVVEMTASDPRMTSASVAFGWVWLTDDQGRRPVWFARLRAMDAEGSIERFADSRDCAGVAESLGQLDDLPVIDPHVPALPPASGASPVERLERDFGGLILHDNRYGIRLRGVFAGARTGERLEIRGGSSAPFAPVIADTLARLKPCWTETPPPRA